MNTHSLGATEMLKETSYISSVTEKIERLQLMGRESNGQGSSRLAAVATAHQVSLTMSS